MSFERDRYFNYQAGSLAELEWIEHGFGTSLTEGWPDANRLSMVRQVHSARVIVSDGRAGWAGEGDALITDRPGIPIAIRTADCVPILIADRKRRSVAAIHAGWRGTAQRIVQATVESLQLHFGSQPEDLIAAIGPGIGVCCYEVGREVARQFQIDFPERSDLGSTTRIDLSEANRRQLARAGLGEGRISVAGICTQCSNEMHSFRRDGAAAGRMTSAIGIRQ